MVGKRSPSKSNGGKKTQGTISLLTISQIKVTSLKSHAKSNRKRKKIIVIKRL